MIQQVLLEKILQVGLMSINVSDNTLTINLSVVVLEKTEPTSVRCKKHWVLFSLLLDRGIHLYVVRLPRIILNKYEVQLLLGLGCK